MKISLRKHLRKPAKKYGETRYDSRVPMSERMINTKRIYEKLMLDQEYMSWLDRQTPKTKEKVRM
jgi:hypothetical protein